MIKRQESLFYNTIKSTANFYLYSEKMAHKVRDTITFLTTFIIRNQRRRLWFRRGYATTTLTLQGFLLEENTHTHKFIALKNMIHLFDGCVVNSFDMSLLDWEILIGYVVVLRLQPLLYSIGSTWQVSSCLTGGEKRRGIKNMLQKMSS